MEIELLGGALDGLRRKRSRRPEPLIYVDGAGRFWSAPRGGRELYRLERRRADGVLIYRHATYEAVCCESCGWWTPRYTGSCLLCTAALPA